MHVKRLLNGSKFCDNHNMDGLVIALVGPEKAGKSTLANKIYEQLTGSRVTLFKAESGDDRTTFGIDYITFPVKGGNVTILDCQGTAGCEDTNAASDLEVLITACYIADVFVYVNRGGITGHAFQGLQHMATFILNYPRKQEPSFVLFCKDYTYDSKPNDKLQKLLTQPGRDYISTAKAIGEMFDLKTAIADNLGVLDGTPELIKVLKSQKKSKLPVEDRYLMGRDAAIATRQAEAQFHDTYKLSTIARMQEPLDTFQKEIRALISETIKAIDGTINDDSRIITIQKRVISLIDKFNDDFKSVPADNRVECIKKHFLENVEPDFGKLLALSAQKSEEIAKAKFAVLTVEQKTIKMGDKTMLSKLFSFVKRSAETKPDIALFYLYALLYSTCSKHYRQSTKMAGISIDKLYDLSDELIDHRSTFGGNFLAALKEIQTWMAKNPSRISNCIETFIKSNDVVKKITCEYTKYSNLYNFRDEDIDKFKKDTLAEYDISFASYKHPATQMFTMSSIEKIDIAETKDECFYKESKEEFAKAITREIDAIISKNPRPKISKTPSIILTESRAYTPKLELAENDVHFKLLFNVGTGAALYLASKSPLNDAIADIIMGKFAFNTEVARKRLLALKEYSITELCANIFKGSGLTVLTTSRFNISNNFLDLSTRECMLLLASCL